MEVYSKLLSEYRERMGWTQDRLAEYLGISRVMVSQIESGTRKPSVKIRHLINGALANESEGAVPVTEEEAQRIAGEVNPKILRYDVKRLKEENEALKAENQYLKDLVATLSESIKNLSADKKNIPPVGVPDIYSNVKSAKAKD